MVRLNFGIYFLVNLSCLVLFLFIFLSIQLIIGSCVKSFYPHSRTYRDGGGGGGSVSDLQINEQDRSQTTHAEVFFLFLHIF